MSGGITAGRVTEVVQLVLGLSIPFLLMNHLFVTRISLAVYGTEKGYAQELYSFWVAAPRLGVLAGVGADRRLDPRLHRPVSMAAAEADVRPLDAVSVLRCRAAAGAGAARLLPGRPDAAGAGAGPRLARRQPQSLADRPAAAEPPACRCGATPACGRRWPCWCWCCWPGSSARCGNGAARRSASPTRTGGRCACRWASACWRRAAAPACRMPASAAAAAAAPPAASASLPGIDVHPAARRPASRRCCGRIGAAPTVRLACQSRPTGDVSRHPAAAGELAGCGAAAAGMAAAGAGAVHRRADGGHARFDPAGGDAAAVRRGVHRRPLRHHRRFGA